MIKLKKRASRLTPSEAIMRLQKLHKNLCWFIEQTFGWAGQSIWDAHYISNDDLEHYVSNNNSDCFCSWPELRKELIKQGCLK